MKLTEFKEHIDWICETYPQEADRELTVVVVTRDPSIGGSACTEVKAVHKGFDWENGRVNIYTEKEVVFKTNPKQLELSNKESEFRKELIKCLETNNGKEQHKLTLGVFKVLNKYFK